MSSHDDDHTPLLISDPSVNKPFRSRTPSPEREYCSDCPLQAKGSACNGNSHSLKHETNGASSSNNNVAKSSSHDSFKAKPKNYDSTSNSNEPISFNEPDSSNSHHNNESICNNDNCCREIARRRSLSPLLILPLNFINAFSWGMIEIPLLFLLRQELCAIHYNLDPTQLSPDDPICRLAEITTGVSKVRAAFGSLAAFLGLFSTAYYGTMGDIYGRRLVLFITVSFLLLGDLWLLYQSYAPKHPYFVLFAAALKGLGGYISTVVASQNSFVADCSKTEFRAWYLGLNFAAYHLGTALGPSLSGFIVQYTPHMYYVFYITSTFWIIYLLYVWLILPESLDVSESKEQQNKISGFSSIWRSCLEPLIILWPRSLCTEESCEFHQYDINADTHAGRRHWDVLLAAILISLTLLGAGSMGLLPLYTDYKFGWGPMKASLILSTDSFASSITLVALFPLLSKVIEKIIEKLYSSEGLFEDPSRADNTSSLQGIRNVFSYLVRPGYSRSSILRGRTADEKYTIVKRDVWNAQLGYAIALSAAVLLAVAKSDVALFTAVIIQAISNMVVPCVQSIALNGVQSEYNGRVLAAFAVFEAVALIIRGPIYAFVYTESMKVSYPNMIFFLSAIIYGCCFIIIFFMRLYRPLNRKR